MRNRKNTPSTGQFPVRHQDHKKPVTRRDFLAQGFLSGLGIAVGPSLLGFLGSMPKAYAAECAGLTPPALDRIPFICFDLAGGANIAGSNVIVGGPGGQGDFASVTAVGYRKLGSLALPATVDTRLGLAFHPQSALLEGIFDKAKNPAIIGKTNGTVFCTRSNDDTSNNPLNPMYGIARAGSKGRLSSTTLIGTKNSLSGGNSVGPGSMNLETLSVKTVSNANQATGLVDTGKLGTLLGVKNAAGESTGSTLRVMQAVEKISAAKSGQISEAQVVKDILGCSYTDTATQVQNSSDTSKLNPISDPQIIGGTVNGATVLPIFTAAEIGNSGNGVNGNFRKTAAIMKLVVEGHVGAGTVELGGYDYHDGNRINGENKDREAGRCIGAVLEYASRLNKPVMIYVYTDGGVSSNGTPDPAAGGKPQWTSDNGSTAAAFFLVYNPKGVTSIKQQIGYFTNTGSVFTGTAAVKASVTSNNVTQLSEAIVLNYLALHGSAAVGTFDKVLPMQGLGSSTVWDQYIGVGQLDLAGITL